MSLFDEMRGLLPADSPLRQLLREVEKRYEHLEEQLAALDEGVRDTQTANNSLTGANTELQTELSELRDEVRDLSNDLAEQQGHARELEVSKNRQIDVLNERLEEVRAERDRYYQDLRGEQTTNRLLRQQVEELESRRFGRW